MRSLRRYGRHIFAGTFVSSWRPNTGTKPRAKKDARCRVKLRGGGEGIAHVPPGEPVYATGQVKAGWSVEETRWSLSADVNDPAAKFDVLEFMLLR